MNSNQELITRFYTAFQKGDWQTMGACYHPQATFHDPAFRHLQSREVKAMWHMLTASAKDLKVEFNQVSATDMEGSCRWDAWYTFSRTGKQVHNIIQASFEFKDGLIYNHKDVFDFWRWSRMALGTPAVLLGWTPYLRDKVHATARKGLDKFIAEHPEYRG